MAVETWWVSWLVTVIWALARTAPVESLTVPAMAPATVFCAWRARPGARKRTRAANRNRLRRNWQLIIVLPPHKTLEFESTSSTRSKKRSDRGSEPKEAGMHCQAGKRTNRGHLAES